MSNSVSLAFEEFEEALRSAHERGTRRLEALSSLSQSESLFLFGYGGKGRALALHIAGRPGPDVVIYDSRPEARRLARTEGFQTVDRLEDIIHGTGQTILGACQAQIEQSDLLGGRGIFYHEAAHLFDAPHLANSTRDFRNWAVRHVPALFELHERVHALSRDTLRSVLKFRLSLNPRELAGCRRRNADMWFDIPEVYARRRYRTFLDVGAYDGDTLRHALARLSVSRGIAVEANADLFEAIRMVGRDYADGVLILPNAAWSHRCRLAFSQVRGGMITVSESIDGELAAAPIDEQISEPVDFMKMDIEGAEIPALEGASSALKAFPDLAVAAYHRPDDLAKLPAFLSSAGYSGDDFDLHLAHYSECLDDTIMYLIRRH